MLLYPAQLVIGTALAVEAPFAAAIIGKLGYMGGKKIYQISDKADAIVSQCSPLFGKAMKVSLAFALSTGTLALAERAFMALPGLAAEVAAMGILPSTINGAIKVALIPCAYTPWLLTAAATIGVVVGVLWAAYQASQPQSTWSLSEVEDLEEDHEVDPDKDVEDKVASQQNNIHSPEQPPPYHEAVKQDTDPLYPSLATSQVQDKSLTDSNYPFTDSIKWD